MANSFGGVFKGMNPEQLTGLDASFIYLESARSPMHIGAIAIYDPSTAPGGKVRFKDILKFMDDRAHRAKPFYQKLKQVPLGVDHPYWIDDPEFEIEYHVRHIALPHPGDWRQLCIQAARIHARPLDMSKPLWEFTVIEGLDNVPGVPKGSYAVVSKVHHCAIDGASGVEISEAIHSLEPNDVVSPNEERRKSGRSPGNMEMLARANINNVTKPFHALNVGRRMAPGALKYLAGVRSGDFKLMGRKVPRTRFNGAVSAHRVIDAATFDLKKIKEIKTRIPGATVNDAILAIVGGALRKYLEAKDELPDDSLIAMAPVSVRANSEKSAMGNEVTALSIPLGTHIADPLARLHFTHEEASSSKEMANAVGARELSEASKLSPAMVTGVAARLYMRLGLANRLRPAFNTVVTNVPGPPVPLYMAGSRMITSHGIGPAVDSLGLFQAIGSYCGEVTVTATACRDMMPDPSFYADCLRESFEELYAAAVKPEPKKKEPKKRKAPKRKHRSPTLAAADSPDSKTSIH